MLLILDKEEKPGKRTCLYSIREDNKTLDLAEHCYTLSRNLDLENTIVLHFSNKRSKLSLLAALETNKAFYLVKKLVIELQ